MDKQKELPYSNTTYEKLTGQEVIKKYGHLLSDKQQDNIKNFYKMSKKITRDDLLNWWLKKFHNTSVEEVVKNHPKDVLDSPEWFKLYPVTQSQCDEWEEWAKKELIKTKTVSKHVIKNNGLGFIYLDCAPYVKE